MDAPAPPARLRFGPCVLDAGRLVVAAADGSETLLRPKSYDLLRLLLDRAGQVVARGEILDAVWPGLFVTDDSVTQCIVEIRRALGPEGAALLRTVPRRGYVLEAETRPEGAPGPTAPPRLAETRPSIAVVPFRSWHGAGSDAWFEDGVVEGIVHVLSGLPGLFVASRGAALALSDRLGDPREVGRELGVRYVLSGGVQRAASRVRITTELSETESGAVLRSDRYDSEAEDLFGLQDRISAEVVTAIAAPLRENELARARRKPPSSLTAYDLVLQGLDGLRLLEREGFERGVALLQQAAAADRGYALPLSYLALAVIIRLAQGWSEDPLADGRLAARQAEAALRLDPRDALALTARAYAAGYVDHELENARHLTDRAVELAPSLALAWTAGAAVRCWADEGEAAVAWAEHGVRLARLDPFVWLHEHVLGQAYWVAGRHAEAEQWTRRALAADAGHLPAWRVLIAALAAMGREAEARSAAARHFALAPDFRLSALAARTPLRPSVRDRFLGLLRQAGLPD
jgi:TolB-like protein